MKTFVILPLLAFFVFPSGHQQMPPSDGSQLEVLSFKWSKTRQPTDKPGPDKPLPARAMTQADKNFDKNMRTNDPAGVRDPNADTLDARGNELEKNVRASEKVDGKTVDSFAYQAKVHNAGKQTVEIVFWEYRFIDSTAPDKITRRQFLCGVNIKPDKDKEITAVSPSGPPNTVSAGNLANPADGQFQQQVVINRVEFADGKSWTRKDWNAMEIKAAYQRAMATPWSPNEMCRGL